MSQFITFLKFLLYLVKLPFFIIVFVISRLFRSRKYLSLSSASHITLDHSVQRNHVTVMMITQSRLSKQEYLDNPVNVEQYNHQVFTHRIVCGDFQYPYFELIEDYNLSDYFTEIDFDELDDDTLEKEVGKIHSVPFDRKKALFSVHFLQGYQREKTVVVIKIHHCIADGFASLKLFFSMTSRGKDYVKEDWMISKKKRDGKAKMGVWRKIKLAFKSLLKTMNPEDSKHGYFRQKHSSKRHQPVTFHMGRRQHSLTDVKVVTRQIGISVNEFFLSVISSGIRKYLLKYGTPFDKKRLNSQSESLKPDYRANAWVNMRKTSFPQMLDRVINTDGYKMTSEEFENNIGLILFAFPAEIENDIERMKYCAKIARETIYSLEPFISQTLMQTFALFVPPVFQDWLSQKVAYKSSFNFTNVPTSQHVRQLNGRDIERTSILASNFGFISTMFNLLSYNGKFQMSLSGSKHIGVFKELMADIDKSIDEHLQLAARKID